MSHFIEKCSGCDCVISQCRCPSKDKEIRYSLCKNCAANKEKVKACENCKHGLGYMIGTHVSFEGKVIFEYEYECKRHPELTNQPADWYCKDFE